MADDQNQAQNQAAAKQLLTGHHLENGRAAARASNVPPVTVATAQGQQALNPAAAGAHDKMLQYQNAVISDDTQQMLNEPLKHKNGIDPKDSEFLKLLMEKVDKGEINLYRPSSLFNLPIYEKLSGEAQSKADIDAFNLLATVREIRQLWQQGHHDTYQIENLTHRIRLTKERLEELGGDIFII